MVFSELPAISAELYSKLICMLIDAGLAGAAGAGAGAVAIEAAPGRNARVWPCAGAGVSAFRLSMIESTEGALCGSCANALPHAARTAIATAVRRYLVMLIVPSS